MIDLISPRLIMTNPHTTNQPVILIAEDDEDDRLMLTEAFAELALPNIPIFTQDGQELMDYLHKQGKYQTVEDHPLPSLILLDLNMPRKDGREVIREIKNNQKFRNIPIVVLTTSDAETDIFLAYHMGANSYITKPSRFETLLIALKTLHEYWFNTVSLPN